MDIHIPPARILPLGALLIILSIPATPANSASVLSDPLSVAPGNSILIEFHLQGTGNEGVALSFILPPPLHLVSVRPTAAQALSDPTQFQYSSQITPQGTRVSMLRLATQGFLPAGPLATVELIVPFTTAPGAYPLIAAPIETWGNLTMPAASSTSLLGAIGADASLQLGTILVVPANDDMDGDGMPDPWETSFFGDLSHSAPEDYDWDGFSNRQEYIAGTNPTDPLSRLELKLQLLPQQGLVLRWTPAPGRAYKVERALTNSPWMTIAEIQADQDEEVLLPTQTDPPSAQYRLIVTLSLP